jgi:hypothetical protein
MVRAGPEKEAAWIEEQSGVRTVAATDGMRVAVGDAVEVAMAAAPPRPQERADADFPE